MILASPEAVHPAAAELGDGSPPLGCPNSTQHTAVVPMDVMSVSKPQSSTLDTTTGVTTGTSSVGDNGSVYVGSGGGGPSGQPSGSEINLTPKVGSICLLLYYVLCSNVVFLFLFLFYHSLPTRM